VRSVEIQWRGPFTSSETNQLHAEVFGTRVFSDAEWDWRAQLAAHSLGWVTARDSPAVVHSALAGDDRADGPLLGFVNVLWDGEVHAWLQDVMVADTSRHRGVGRLLVAAARDGARAAGCEWLHVDFADDLAPFYLDACGFRPTRAGLMAL
jgi:GNAT superfamily N-acetyltransferase